MYNSRLSNTAISLSRAQGGTEREATPGGAAFRAAVTAQGRDALGLSGTGRAGSRPGTAMAWGTRPCQDKGSQLPRRYHLWGIIHALDSGLSHLNVMSVSPILAEFGAQQFLGAGSICLEAGYCLSASWFFRRLALQTAAELLPKGFQLRENEMLWPPLVEGCWFLGHQVKIPEPAGTLLPGGRTELTRCTRHEDWAEKITPVGNVCRKGLHSNEVTSVPSHSH